MDNFNPRRKGARRPQMIETTSCDIKFTFTIERNCLVIIFNLQSIGWYKRFPETEMKAAISSLISSRNFNLHQSSLSRSIFRQPSLLLPSQFPVSSTGGKPTGASFTSPRHNLRFHSIKSSSIMASSFNPEQARVPPALPLPIPPVTKVSFLTVLILRLF